MSVEVSSNFLLVAGVNLRGQLYISADSSFSQINFFYRLVRFDISKDAGSEKKRSLIANMIGENKAGNGIFAVSSMKANKPPSSTHIKIT